MTAPALMFHHFHGPLHPRVQGSLSAASLEAKLNSLADWTILPAGEWLQRALAGRLAPTDTCLTFDDCLACQFDIANPVLQRRGLTAFWFVYTSVLEGRLIRLELYRKFRNTCFPDIDTFYQAYFAFLERGPHAGIVREALSGFRPERYLSAWSFYTDNDRRYRYLRDDVLGPERYQVAMDEFIAKNGSSLEELSKDVWLTADHIRHLHDTGHVIGLHSHSHPTRLAELPPARQMDEYRQNRDILAQILGAPPISMAHPNNSYSADTLDVLERLGIRLGFCSETNPPEQSLLTMPRIDQAEIGT